MAKNKKYNKKQDESDKVSEPEYAYISVGDSCSVLTNNAELKRAISGTELVNRLRPRIQELFRK